jgi:hypothetical protein
MNTELHINVKESGSRIRVLRNRSSFWRGSRQWMELIVPLTGMFITKFRGQDLGSNACLAGLSISLSLLPHIVC